MTTRAPRIDLGGPFSTLFEHELGPKPLPLPGLDLGGPYRDDPQNGAKASAEVGHPEAFKQGAVDPSCAQQVRVSCVVVDASVLGQPIS